MRFEIPAELQLGHRRRRRGLQAVMATIGLAFVASEAAAVGFNFEISDPTPANQFSGYTYLCPDCTLAQFEALQVPAGLNKRNPRLFLPSSSTTGATSPPAGVPTSLDLLPEIPGDDFLYVAEVLSGTVLGFDAVLGYLLNSVQVQRDNTFTYDAGEVVHEVIDDLGNRHVLFVFDLALAETIDLGQLGALSGFGLPTGWSYQSRVLTAPLVIDSQGLAEVFAHATLFGDGIAVWQRYSVPEPGTGLLIGVGIAAVALARPGRRGPGVAGRD